MTCIVALVAKGKSYMAADSMGFDSFGRRSRRRDAKIFSSQTQDGQEFMIGFTSSYRMGQILQYAFNPSGYKKGCNSDELFEYMTTTFIKEVIQTFKENGFGSIKDGEASAGGTFIVAIKDKIYSIHDDFQVGEGYSNYLSCGSGYDYAYASLYTTEQVAPDMDPQDRLQLAIETAIELCNTVGGEVLHLTMDHPVT